MYTKKNIATKCLGTFMEKKNKFFGVCFAMGIIHLSTRSTGYKKRKKKKNISHDNKIRVVKWKSISKQIPHRLMGDSHCSGQTKLQITKKNDKKNICNVKE